MVRSWPMLYVSEMSGHFDVQEPQREASGAGTAAVSLCGGGICFNYLGSQDATVARAGSKKIASGVGQGICPCCQAVQRVNRQLMGAMALIFGTVTG